MNPTRPYSGIRIIDMTWWLGSYVGRLFADLGADVVRVEPPEGLPDRRRTGEGYDARFAFLNASKRSLVLPLDTAGGRRQLDRLVATSQVVLLERDGPLFAELGAIRSSRHDLVVTAVSPFGMTGPLSEAPASDLVLQAAGGIAWMSGRIDDAPLRLPFEQSVMVTSIYAATVTAIALRDAEVHGTGHLIDVSAQECIAHSLQNAIQVWDLERRISIRGGEGTRDASEDIFPCRDGFVFLAAPLALGNSWKSLVAYVEEAGHASAAPLTEPRWSDREWRLTAEARAAFRDLFSAFTLERSKEELAREAIARRIVMAPVSRFPDLFDDPQLAHRRFFGSQPGPDGRLIPFPGAPYKLSLPVWQATPAPPLGSGEEPVRHGEDASRMRRAAR